MEEILQRVLHTNGSTLPVLIALSNQDAFRAFLQDIESWLVRAQKLIDIRIFFVEENYDHVHRQIKCNSSSFENTKSSLLKQRLVPRGSVDDSLSLMLRSMYQPSAVVVIDDLIQDAPKQRSGTDRLVSTQIHVVVVQTTGYLSASQRYFKAMSDVTGGQWFLYVFDLKAPIVQESTSSDNKDRKASAEFAQVEGDLSGLKGKEHAPEGFIETDNEIKKPVNIKSFSVYRYSRKKNLDAACRSDGGDGGSSLRIDNLAASQKSVDSTKLSGLDYISVSLDSTTVDLRTRLEGNLDNSCNSFTNIPSAMASLVDASSTNPATSLRNSPTSSSDARDSANSTECWAENAAEASKQAWKFSQHPGTSKMKHLDTNPSIDAPPMIEPGSFALAVDTRHQRWNAAVVLACTQQGRAEVQFSDGSLGILPLEHVVPVSQNVYLNSVEMQESAASLKSEEYPKPQSNRIAGAQSQRWLLKRPPRASRSLPQKGSPNPPQSLWSGISEQASKHFFERDGSLKSVIPKMLPHYFSQLKISHPGGERDGVRSMDNPYPMSPPTSNEVQSCSATAHNGTTLQLNGATHVRMESTAPITAKTTREAASVESALTKETMFPKSSQVLREPVATAEIPPQHSSKQRTDAPTTTRDKRKRLDISLEVKKDCIQKKPLSLPTTSFGSSTADWSEVEIGIKERRPLVKSTPASRARPVVQKPSTHQDPTVNLCAVRFTFPTVICQLNHPRTCRFTVKK